jgi:hypothetical protein
MDKSKYRSLPVMDETGYAVVDMYDQSADPREWENLVYVDWKSSGDTRFAPLASAYGDMECNGFWNHTPPKTDNNRLNPEGTGWIVRAFFNLTDDPDSVMILRADKDDPSTEVRIPLPAGQQVVIDTQGFYHAVWHPGDKPRYCLITSYESGPELDAWIAARNPRTRLDNHPIDPVVQAEGEEVARAKREARAEALAAQGQDPRFGDGSMAVQQEKEVLSEA